MQLYLATAKGLIVAERLENEWRVTSRPLAGRELTCIAASGDTVYAGGTKGVHRSTDRGVTWAEFNAGLSIKHTRWIATAADQVYVGTEPASIFVLRSGESAWRECAEIGHLRDQHRWFLPYSPEAGCIRGFAFHGTRAYAAAEVGGVLRSEDGGATWGLAAGSSGDPSFGVPAPTLIYPDVHSIDVHPSSSELVYAPTGAGFYRSQDGGTTWHSSYDCYVRAAWIDPADPDHIILGPADGVSSNGRIEESRDGGRSWQKAGNGLKTPWPRHMVERFVQVADELLAVLSNGEVVAAPLAALDWRRILADVPDVRAVCE